MDKSLTLLGIETSCDETSIAIMQEGKLRSHMLVSQAMHAPYGGVVPELAARAHQENIVTIAAMAFKEANLTPSSLDGIAVTQGPGLLGSLLVGTSFANGLAISQRIPLWGVHHTKAHLLANFIAPPLPTFPFLGLVVSGGHTQLIKATTPIDMVLLGSTVDDAIGEAFDKIAKMMGMPYPGGVHIDRSAAKGNPERFSFPIPAMEKLLFSFSGLKTSFRYFIAKQSKADPDFVQQHKEDLCASIQATLVKTIYLKVEKALKMTKLPTLVLGGGVANNSLLRRELSALAKKLGIALFIPAPLYCTDNAAMIAMAGHFIAQSTQPLHHITPLPRMPF